MFTTPFTYLSNRFGTLDPDAAAYIIAVETADGQTLEPGVITAINDFVVGCKADGIWNAIKASCILAGARTLSGSLTPLKGTAPTNFNFVSGDYNRKTGLVGDGSTKYLNSNRNNNADPQNSNHNAVYVRSSPTGNFAVFIGSDGGATVGGNIIQVGGTGLGTVNDLIVQNRLPAITTVITGEGAILGFKGTSRNNSSNFNARYGGTSATRTSTSNTPTSSPVVIFAITTTGTISGASNARIAFYSIGESLDLALLDTRVTNLINAIDAAI
jgi:hypothetical protein